MAEGVLESELFGHERGAFTGAQYRRKGKLELSDGGTLFLDEIGNIDMKTQMDLLRVIETKQFTRSAVTTSSKLISGLFVRRTKIWKKLSRRTFREDLYYRLNVFSVFIPPLRERKGDIPVLANYFVQKYSMRTMGKQITSITPEAMDTIVRYNWPGNVRELENAIERAMVVGKPPAIRPEDLPYQLTEKNHVLAGGFYLQRWKNHTSPSVLDQNRWNISRSAEIFKSTE